MKKNMGVIDQGIRIVLAIAIGILYAMNIVKGTLGLVLMIIAGVLVLTTLINFCPLYTIFGIHTGKKKE